MRYTQDMAKTVPMSFRLDPDLKAKLQKLADQDRRSLTNYVEVLLEKHISAQPLAKPGKSHYPK